MSIEDLLEQAKAGTVAPGEVRKVGDALRAEPDNPQAYKMIYLLGLGRATGYDDLIASYLDEPDDPWLARIALQVLVNHFGLGTEYRDRLREFVAGVDWDEDGDVRDVAMSAAGELARESGDRELVGQLVAIAEDDDEEEPTRDVAFDAIGRALGLGWDDLRTRSARPPDDPWVRSLFERAHAYVEG